MPNDTSMTTFRHQKLGNSTSAPGSDLCPAPTPSSGSDAAQMLIAFALAEWLHLAGLPHHQAQV